MTRENRINNENQKVRKKDCLKNSDNTLIHIEEDQNGALPPTAPIVDLSNTEDMLLADLDGERQRYNKSMAWYQKDMRSHNPPRPLKKRRYIGKLESRADVRRELVALYKETYYGHLTINNLTRYAYLLNSITQTFDKGTDKRPATVTKKQR